MDINLTPNQSALYLNFSQKFAAAYAEAKSYADQVSDELPSDTRTETYAWMDFLLAGREWRGSREIQDVIGLGYSLTNKRFEGTVGLDIDDVEDNRINQFGPTLQRLGRAAKMIYDRLLFSQVSTVDANKGVMFNAENLLTFDAVNFFSAAHPIDISNPALGVQSNYYSTGYALTMANFATVYTNGESLIGRDLMPLGILFNKLVIPPALRTAARQICKADIIATAVGINAAQAQSNVWKDTVDPVEIPLLNGDPSVWYLLDTTLPIKPFIRQLRKAPQFVSLARPSDPNVFWEHKLIYGYWTRLAAGLGLWWGATKARA